MRKCSFLTLELALLLALAATLLWGAWSLHRQDDLQEKMIRLHVIANSDSDADQTLKLCVRDAVLCRADDHPERQILPGGQGKAVVGLAGKLRILQ